MAQPATNPKIEELRFKVKTDPKSRLFFPLAEELRKIGQLAEAEVVLRAGLVSHAAYLSGWVSLGRVLRELGKDKDAVDVLQRALQIDPGNVVAARLLAESYLAIGEKVEAIKKFKLVHALLPADEEIEEIVRRLDLELNAPSIPVVLSEADNGMEEMVVERSGEAKAQPAPPAAPPPTPPPPPPPAPAGDGNVFDITYTKLKKEIDVAIATGDVEPMSAAHAENPFGEPAGGGYGSDAFDIEQPEGFHLDGAPPTTEMPMPRLPEPLPIDGASAGDYESDVFEPASEIAPGFIQGSFSANVPPPPPEAGDFAKTIIMADLYANQGLIDEARDIYEDILARDPDNEAVRERLDALGEIPAARQEWGEPEPETAEDEQEVSAPATAAAPEPPPASPPARNPKVDKLEGWLAKVKRGEVRDV